MIPSCQSCISGKGIGAAPLAVIAKAGAAAIPDSSVISGSAVGAAFSLSRHRCRPLPVFAGSVRTVCRQTPCRDGRQHHWHWTANSEIMECRGGQDFARAKRPALRLSTLREVAKTRGELSTNGRFIRTCWLEQSGA